MIVQLNAIIKNLENDFNIDFLKGSRWTDQIKKQCHDEICRCAVDRQSKSFFNCSQIMIICDNAVQNPDDYDQWRFCVLELQNRKAEDLIQCMDMYIS